MIFIRCHGLTGKLSYHLRLSNVHIKFFVVSDRNRFLAETLDEIFNLSDSNYA